MSRQETIYTDQSEHLFRCFPTCW